jgi:hypothetical protein
MNISNPFWGNRTTPQEEGIAQHCRYGASLVLCSTCKLLLMVLSLQLKRNLHLAACRYTTNFSATSSQLLTRIDIFSSDKKSSGQIASHPIVLEQKANSLTGPHRNVIAYSAQRLTNLGFLDWSQSRIISRTTISPFRRTTGLAACNFVFSVPHRHPMCIQTKAIASTWVRHRNINTPRQIKDQARRIDRNGKDRYGQAQSKSSKYTYIAHRVCLSSLSSPLGTSCNAANHRSLWVLFRRGSVHGRSQGRS